MNCNCENCGWSEIIGSPIICHYTGNRTFRDKCCEAWKPKEEEKPDMVEVVRCKDCVHWDEHLEECENKHSVCFRNGLCEAEWFCSDGERKDEEHE